MTNGRTVEDLRVALFCANFYGVTDGASNTLKRLVNYLLEQGVAVRVYSAAVANRPPASTVDVVRVPSFVVPGRPEYRISLGLTPRVRADVESFRPNIVHTSVPDLLGTQAQAFARHSRIPFVASMHTRFETYLDYYRLGFLRPLIERRLKRFYSRCDLVLAPSAAIADELRDSGWSHNVDIWGRGVDRTLFNPARRSLEWRRRHGFGDEDIVLLFFGRLVLEKGIASFVATVDELKACGTKLRLLVVGDGPQRAHMERLLPDAVFTGHLAGEELATAVASADILLNPSVTEAFGNVNLEAMASGLAIVSADVPSARALMVDGKSSLLIEPDDAAAYVAAVETLVRSPIRRQELAVAAVDASAAFDWSECLRVVVDSYLALPVSSR